MSESIPVDQLAAAITHALQEYTDDVSDAVSDEIDKIAKECMAEIKARSPASPKPKYAKGWKMIKENGDGYVKRIIWNKKYPWLVHLLEKGHAKRNGGRVIGRLHVLPAEMKYVAKLERRIPQIVRNGGE